MITVKLPIIDSKTRESAIKKWRKLINKKSDQAALDLFLNSCNSPKYKRWERVKHATFKDFSAQELWFFLSLKRKQSSIDLPMKTDQGELFSFAELPEYRKLFHEFDLLTSGNILSNDAFHEKSFIQDGIIEESIESSRIEGAVTSVKEAKKMLKTGQKPRDKSDQMILNNYNTMEKIKSEWKDEELTLELLFEIHTSITQQTDVEEKDMFRLRKNDDKITVSDSVTSEIAYICPDEDFLKTEIIRLIDFANNKLDPPNAYLHPLLKAIMLHFWIGYLHPFTDGNGRTARSLFYWYLLKNGCWAIPFLPISNKIIKSYGQYRDAFLLTEQVDNDFTYFFDYHIKQIMLSMKDFEQKVQNLKKETQIENKLLIKENFNTRQVALLRYFYVKKNSKTTYNIHKNYHKIHLLSARSDLLNLTEKGFLASKKSGRNVYFFPTEKITPLFL